MDNSKSQQVLSYLYIAFLFTSSAILFIVALVIWLVTIPFDKQLRILHYFTMWWSSIYIQIVPTWKIKTKGREKVDFNKAYVIVSNHQSYLDIMAASFLFIPFKWVSKAEIFKVPFVGWNMKLNNYIELERGGRRSVAKMMTKCENTIKNGSSVFLFPEGTRSIDGNMRTFMPGAFVLAKRMKVDVLPIVINGTRDAVPKNSFRINNNAIITIQVLDPISYSDFADISAAELAHQTQTLINAELKRKKNPN